MVPGQSTEDLGQRSRTVRAGEDEESSQGSRSSRRRQLRKLPAAAGNAAGAERPLPASSSQPAQLLLGAVFPQPREAKALSGHAVSVSESASGENVE